jgi:hypothetical protein
LCAPEWWPAENGAGGFPFAPRIGVQGLCTMQGTNETQPLALVLFAVPSASGWGAGLAPDRCHPMRPACPCPCPCPGAVPLCWRWCPCWLSAGLALFDAPCAALRPPDRASPPPTCEPVPLGAMRPEWWPADKGAGGVSFCAANRCARLLHHARYKPSPPFLTW